METTNTFIDQLLGLPFTVGLVFLAAGLIQRFFPPKKINSFYGYRTTNSMKSQPRWEFAQQYSSGLMMLAGFFLLLQGFAEIARCVMCLRNGYWPEREADVQEVDVEKLKELVHVKDEDIQSLDKYVVGKEHAK